MEVLPLPTGRGYGRRKRNRMITTFVQKLIETAREFPRVDDIEVVSIARIRTERAENKPEPFFNLYIRAFSHFEDENPVFKWENWGVR